MAGSQLCWYFVTKQNIGQIKILTVPDEIRGLLTAPFVELRQQLLKYWIYLSPTSNKFLALVFSWDLNNSRRDYVNTRLEVWVYYGTVDVELPAFGHPILLTFIDSTQNVLPLNTWTLHYISIQSLSLENCCHISLVNGEKLPKNAQFKFTPDEGDLVHRTHES